MQISPVRVWRYNERRRRFLGVVGTLVSYSVVRVGPQGMESKTPYIVGLVKIGKERVMIQIVGVNTEDLRTGMRLVGRLRRLFTVDPDAVVVYGVKFCPPRSD